MSVVQSEKKLTEVEFLRLERKGESKNEFFDGEAFAMSGGTRWHSLIGTNLAREFGNKLQSKPCVPYNSDLRVKVEASGLLTYPDLSVVCGEAKFLDEQMDTLLNPTVIVEVLSDSTEAYDRGKKFEQYRQLPSLREYLLVSQKEPRIEQYLRQRDDQWLLRERWGADAQLELPCLGVHISLAEVYARVEFSPSTLRSRTSPNS